MTPQQVMAANYKTPIKVVFAEKMPEEMKQHAFRTIRSELSAQHANYQVAASKMAATFEAEYGGLWSCIVGLNYGYDSYCPSEVGSCIRANVGRLQVRLFKPETGSPLAPAEIRGGESGDVH